MQRDVGQLTRQTFDLLIVGGGIYGLTIACDAAGRGLSVALIERDDFGSGSSFNHLRTIHGGLRYLQKLDIGRARESILERRALARIAPRAVRPMPFVLPLASSLTRGPLAMRAGFLLDRLVGRDRNVGIAPSLHLPAGRVVSPREALDQFPELAGQAISGAAIWYDYVTTEADRLTFAWGVSAAQKGAVLANYVLALDLISEGSRVVGARAQDRNQDRNGEASLEIRARVTVNATGVFMRHLGKPAHAPQSPILKAMNLVTSRPAGPAALGGRSASGRNLFLVPWRGRALFGTWESPNAVPYEDYAHARPSDVEGFIDEINQAFPSVNLRLGDVTLVHRGLVAGVAASDGNIRLEGHDRIEDLAPAGLDGLFTVVGAKYTTARAVAERVVDHVLVKLGRQGAQCRTALDPLPDVFDRLEGDDALVRAVRDEMAMTLRDAVIRRTPLGALGCPSEALLLHAAEVVGRELGWAEPRKGVEIQAVRSFYDIGSG